MIKMGLKIQVKLELVGIYYVLKLYNLMKLMDRFDQEGPRSNTIILSGLVDGFLYQSGEKNETKEQILAKIVSPRDGRDLVGRLQYAGRN